MSDDPRLERCLLFVYGLLQPGHRPPRTMSRHWPDQLLGELYDLGPYPGLLHAGVRGGPVSGTVVEVSRHELETVLDPFELVEEGLYRRIRATTVGGHEVWVYEYARPLPPGARGPLERWG